MAYGKITAKQKEILEYIKEEILKKGYPPSVREICGAVNLKINLFCTFSFGNIGEKWIYSQRSNETPCN